MHPLFRGVVYAVLLPNLIERFYAHAIADSLLGEETNEGPPFQIVAQDCNEEGTLLGLANGETFDRDEV
jgi:hypothetical protein